MNKKILLVFSLLLSTVALAGAVSSTLLSSTSAQELQSAAYYQEQITNLENEKADLENRKVTLVMNAITGAGCSVVPVSSPAVPNFLGIGYQCPSTAADENSPAPLTRLLRAFILLNPQITEINAKIDAINNRLPALLELLARALGTAAVPEPPLPDADTSTAPQPPALSNADLALLAGFDPVDAPAMVEEYFVPALDPTIRLNGPNGPVKGAIENGTIYLAEEVVLLPGQALEIPQMDIAIVNDSPSPTAYISEPQGFIPKASAQFLARSPFICTACEPLYTFWQDTQATANEYQDVADRLKAEAVPLIATAESLEFAADVAQSRVDELNRFFDNTSSASIDGGEPINSGDVRLLREARNAISNNSELSPQQKSDQLNDLDTTDLQRLRDAKRIELNQAEADSANARAAADAARAIADAAIAAAASAQTDAYWYQARADAALFDYNECLKRCKYINVALGGVSRLVIAIVQGQLTPIEITRDENFVEVIQKKKHRSVIKYTRNSNNSVTFHRGLSWNAKEGTWVKVIRPPSGTATGSGLNNIIKTAGLQTPPVAAGQDPEQERRFLECVIETKKECLICPGEPEICTDNHTDSELMDLCYQMLGIQGHGG